TGRILEGKRYRHSEPGIRALCARLVHLGVALERPDGLLIERLLDAGLAVVAVHPNQVKAMRPRFSVAGGKSDSFDSFVLAEQALETFLKRHGYPGRKPARELLAKLLAGAEGRAGELETAARREVVLALVSALEPIVKRISELTIEIRHALDEHPDGPTFRSLFIAHDSWLCAATMIAEIGDCRERYPTYRALAADAGQCPVAVESGKAKHAQFRWACDHRLRKSFCTLSDASRRHNPWAADIYNRARARGASHTHATRILGRAWSQIIWRVWRDHDSYYPHQHTALQKLIAATRHSSARRADLTPTQRRLAAAVTPGCPQGT